MMEVDQAVLALGMMSGTSADGVDVALVRTDGAFAFEFLDAFTVPYGEAIREQLLRIASQSIDVRELTQLELEITELHAEAANELIRRHHSLASQLSVAGFHGHTVRHVPDRGWTWQIGDPCLLRERISCSVVSHFRQRDMIAGGQGAPLAPLFHHHQLIDQPRPLVVLNLGGVANITWLGGQGRLLAGDTGPGCCLLDSWAKERTQTSFDQDGELAMAGQVNWPFVEQVCRHPFFQQELPKSADRFDFDFIDVSHLSTIDGAATLCAITARTITAAIRRCGKPSRILVTGGGARHPKLMQLLRDEFSEVDAVESVGLRAESLEAECFAWLAVRKLRGLPTCLPETTGCREPTCGGLLTK